MVTALHSDCSGTSRASSNLVLLIQIKPNQNQINFWGAGSQVVTALHLGCSEEIRARSNRVLLIYISPPSIITSTPPTRPDQIPIPPSQFSRHLLSIHFNLYLSQLHSCVLAAPPKTACCGSSVFLVSGFLDPNFSVPHLVASIIPTKGSC